MSSRIKYGYEYCPSPHDIIYCMGRLPGGACVELQHPPQCPNITIAYINIDGIKSKHLAVKAFMLMYNVDLVIIAESKLHLFKSIPEPIIFHTATHNNNYGMAVALHPKYAQRDLVISSHDCFHINIEFLTFNVLGIYIPSGETNKFEFLKNYFGALINENTIVIGDFNMPLNCPRASSDHGLLDYLLAKRLIYQDLNDTDYTFHRQASNQDQFSFVDHLFIPLNYTIDIINPTTTPTDVSYHSFVQFTVNQQSIPLLPKN